MATFTGQAGTNNTFTGTAGADTFLWAAADLDNQDHAAGGGGSDLLKLTSAGALAATALAGITAIERFTLAAGGNAITLLNANFAGVAGAKILVKGGAGDDTVTASALTGTNAIDVTAGSGLDVLMGGAGRDVFRFGAVELDGDTISGGAGRDLLVLTTPGTLALGVAAGMRQSAFLAAGTPATQALRNMSGVETIQLAAGGNDIHLLDANFAGVAHARIVVHGAAGGDTINASGLTGANAIDVTSGAGNDAVYGGAGRDTFRFKAADLNGDVLRGYGGRDLLLLTSGGVLQAHALDLMNGVETIKLAKAGNTVELIDANFANVAGGKIVVTGGAGDDTVSGAGLTGTNAIDVRAGAGADQLVGGAGRDTFRFGAADLAGDVVHGNGGNDQLLISTGGALASGALAGVDGVETIHLAKAGNAIALVDSNFTGVAGGKITVIGGAGDDRVDASALSAANAVDATVGAGLDTVRGGAGNDTFRFAPANLAGDTITGGDGSDTLVLTGAGALAPDALVHMSAVETIALSVAGNGITLTDANFAGLNGTIVVNGNAGNDTVDASALSSTNAVTVYAGGGLDTLKGGAGFNNFMFKAADLNGDTVVGGNVDEEAVILLTAGTLAPDALRNVSGIEQFVLADGGNGITLTDANFANVTTFRIQVFGQTGKDTIDASGLTGTNAIYVSELGGQNTIKGGAGDDVFRFYSTNTTPNTMAGDTISGGAGNDTVALFQSGPVAANALAGMTGVEQIKIGPPGQAISLTDANFAGVTGPITVTGNRGNDTVDASALTGSNAIIFTTLGGIDTVKGGAGDDVFQFSTAPVAGETISGGGGYDKLELMTGGPLAPDALTQMTGVDEIDLAAGGNMITLTDANYAVPLALPGAPPNYIGIRASAGSSIIDGSGLTGANSLLVLDGGGTETVLGGAGDDVLNLRGGHVFGPADSFDGGAGTDLISIDTSMDLLGNTIHNVEQLINFGSAAVTVNISGENAAGLLTVGSGHLNGVNDIFNVFLSANSTTDLSHLQLLNPDAADAINVEATDGNNSVTLSDQIASFSGGTGRDTVTLAPGGHYRSGADINGGGGDDMIVYDPGSSASLEGGSGYDKLVLLDGATVDLSGADGNTMVGTTSVNDFEGVDASLSAAAVTLTGRSDINSLLIGGSGGDQITAGAGGAYIIGGLGADTLTGGVANDVFIVGSTADVQGDTIDGKGGVNEIVVGGDTDLSAATISNIQTLTLLAGDGLATYKAEPVTATVSGSQAMGLTNIGGNPIYQTAETLVVNANAATLDLSNLHFSSWDALDTVVINGTDGNDTITGTSVNDVIDGGAGTDTISGGDGDDVIRYYLNNTAGLDGGAGNDTIRVTGGAFLTIDLQSQVVRHTLGFFSTTSSATGFENVDDSANASNTRIVGSDAANVLVGGTGNDMITGGQGSDWLTGGAGADTFIWNNKSEGSDTITDFTPGADKLAFAAAAFTVNGAFDTVQTLGDLPHGLSPDVSSTDLLITSTVLDSSSEVRFRLDYAGVQSSDHGMFILAPNSNGHEILYYTPDASSSPSVGTDNNFYQIADLGTGSPNLTAADFLLF